MSMNVSIVIPPLNEKNHVGPVLADIARQTRKPDEMIVVDGRSQDARLAALKATDDGAESLAVAGGDGSVAVKRELLLVVVPTGMLNHFARDLGLDLAHPLRAHDAFYAGHERRVDLGRINGRPYVNNVSL